MCPAAKQYHLSKFMILPIRKKLFMALSTQATSVHIFDAVYVHEANSNAHTYWYLNVLWVYPLREVSLFTYAIWVCVSCVGLRCSAVIVVWNVL